LLCSTVAWASLPHSFDGPRNEQREWQALGVAPLSAGGVSGISMAPTGAMQPIEFMAKRAPVAVPATPSALPAPVDAGPLRITGRVGDGLYWSLRAAGASPQ